MRYTNSLFRLLFFVPAELPARYAIDFVPASIVSPDAVAVTSVTSPIVSSTLSLIIVLSTDYSVVSSVNFVVPSPVIVSSSSPSTCIEPN